MKQTLRPNKKKTTIRSAPCGTPTGYEAHLRRHERPCGRCLIGSNTYTDKEIRELIGAQYANDRDQQLWSAYRLTLDHFERIFKEQGERCACCFTKAPGAGTWCVDHDPNTELIRGIVCPNCNKGIGLLGDNSEGLQRAVSYLRAHEERGGHPQAADRPQPRSPQLSASMRRCFELFRQNVPLDRVVVIMRLTPATVEEIYKCWCSRDEDLRPVNRHIFQTAKEPMRCLCSCGFTVACNNDPDEILRATATVNAHIKAANDDHESTWLALELEEEAKRNAEAKQESERRRQQAQEDMLRRRGP